MSTEEPDFTDAELAAADAALDRRDGDGPEDDGAPDEPPTPPVPIRLRKRLGLVPAGAEG